MARKDYPFDPNSGNYITAWAAEGESAASASDLARWQSSHGGSVSKKQPSPVRKVSSSKKAAPSRTSTYTIKSGDTLGAIARKHSTTVAKIKAANGLKSDLIRAGKTLKIPR
jgi:LysM repeat protein